MASDTSDGEDVPVDRVLAQLAVKLDRGLSSAEAQQRLNKYGPNTPIEKEISLAPLPPDVYGRQIVPEM